MFFAAHGISLITLSPLAIDEGGPKK